MSNLYQDTIIAPATIPGTGAVSILRISGTDSFRVVDEIVSLKHGTVSESKGFTIHLGTVEDSSGAFLDEVLVSVFRAPHSYTGEDSVEISCHASSYIVSEIIRRFLSEGVRMAEPGEFTKRSFLNGRMDLAQAEAVVDVISSSASASHRVAVNQLRGGFSQDLAQLRTRLLEMSSLLELELDFSEEDVTFADRGRLMDLVSGAISEITSLMDSFHKGNAIRNGIPVVIVGPTNAGKSTLLNALLNEDRAIVSEVAGTTRDTIEEIVNIGGLPFRFIDTAGLRKTREDIERMGIERSYQKLSHAEIVLAVFDICKPRLDLLNSVSEIISLVDFHSQQVILVFNKVDLLSNLDYNKIVININNYVLSLDKQINTIFTSAKEKNRIEEIKNLLFTLKNDYIPEMNSTFVTNFRHYEALKDASDSLSRVRSSLASGLPSDLVSADLRLALDALGSITGEVTSQDILNHIFANHCIGK